MINFKEFKKNYMENKNKYKKRYNMKFTIGVFFIFLLYSILGQYVEYDLKCNIVLMLGLMVYIGIWDLMHPLD